MGTFKAYFKKEILESIRQYRYIIIFIGILFLAVSGPVMYKILPKLLESQSSDKLSAFMASSLQATIASITPKDILGNFIGSIFQTGTLIMVFTFCTILSDEIVSQKFVFPFSKGGSPSSVVLAKTIHYSIVIYAAVLLGFLVNYYYAGLLFKGDGPSILSVILSSSLVSLFFIFNLMVTMLFSLLLKKGIAAGIIVLMLEYFSPLLANINAIKEFIPYNLINAANSPSTSNSYKSIIFVSLLILALIFITIKKLRGTEVSS